MLSALSRILIVSHEFSCKIEELTINWDSFLLKNSTTYCFSKLYKNKTKTIILHILCLNAKILILWFTSTCFGVIVQFNKWNDKRDDKYCGFISIQGFQFSWLKWKFQGYVNLWPMTLSIQNMKRNCSSMNIYFKDKLNKEINQYWYSTNIQRILMLMKPQYMIYVRCTCMLFIYSHLTSVKRAG